MDNAAKLAVYKAQVQNVRSLQTALRQTHKLVNSTLRRNDPVQAEHFTKVYALLFCTWAEANFLKVIYTPHALDLDEIEQIKVAKHNSIPAAWKKTVQLGLRHLNARRGSFQPNAKKKLESLIDTHVMDPSLLRNKLAHGQWAIALNRENTAINQNVTANLAALDIVKVAGWIEVHTMLAHLVETLLESPQRTFTRDWFADAVKLGERMSEIEKLTLTEHIARMKAKDATTGAHVKRRVAAT